MSNPFSNIKEDTNDRVKQQLQKQIKSSAWNITKKVAIGQCRTSDIDELENLYKEYFKKFPDTESENNSIKRISQLRQIVK